MFANLNALRMPTPVGPARPWGGLGQNPPMQPQQPGQMPTSYPVAHQPVPIQNPGQMPQSPVQMPQPPMQPLQPPDQGPVQMPQFPGFGGPMGGNMGQMQGGDMNQFDPQQFMRMMAMQQMMRQQY